MSDPYWSNVTLAMHMDGVNNSTTFTDLKGKTVTPYGNAKISTTQSKFGGSSAYFDGSGDYLSVPNLFGDFGLSDFVFEAWVRLSNSTNGTFFSYFDATSGSNKRVSFLFTAGNIYLAYQSNSADVGITVIAPNILPINEWVFVSASRNNGVGSIFVNGIMLANGSFNVNINWNAPLKIGVFNEFDPIYGLLLNGYIDDTRITKGVARYTSNFTPPTQAFPNSDVATNTSSMFLVF